MSVSLIKSDCSTCRAVRRDVDVVTITNTWSAVWEVELSLRDYREALEIHTANPTGNTRALVALAEAQLAQSVLELPTV